LTKQEDNTGAKLIETERTIVRSIQKLKATKMTFIAETTTAWENSSPQLWIRNLFTSRRQRVVLRGNFSNWSPAISDAISVIEVQIYNQRI